MKIRTLTPAAAVVVAALALGACGGGGEAGAEPKAKTPEEAGLAFARCMREQGIDFPDPQTDENGLTRIGPKGLKPGDPKLETATEACREHLEGAGTPPDLSEEDRREMEEAALNFSRCMRENGIDFPDPTGDGGIRLGPDSGVDLQSEEFRAAEEACRDEMPMIQNGGSR